MREWKRIEQRVRKATDSEIEAWQEALNERLFDCGFAGARTEFLRLLSNAYHKFPQYREAICDEVGVQGDAATARRRSLINLILTIVVVLISVVTLLLTVYK